MTGWSFLVYVCTPFPLILLVILTVPLPRSFRRAVLATTKRIIFLPLAGGLQAIHVMLMISAAAFVDQSYRTTELRGRDRPLIQADVLVLKSKIWRSERNFWIALFCFFVWWMLSAYYRTLIQYMQVRSENDDLKKQLKANAAAGQPSTADKKND